MSICKNKFIFSIYFILQSIKITVNEAVLANCFPFLSNYNKSLKHTGQKKLGIMNFN